MSAAPVLKIATEITPVGMSAEAVTLLGQAIALRPESITLDLDELNELPAKKRPLRKWLKIFNGDGIQRPFLALKLGYLLIRDAQASQARGAGDFFHVRVSKNADESVAPPARDLDHVSLTKTMRLLRERGGCLELSVDLSKRAVVPTYRSPAAKLSRTHFIADHWLAEHFDDECVRLITMTLDMEADALNHDQKLGAAVPVPPAGESTLTN